MTDRVRRLAGPLKPHSVIGILGGGQLAKMLAQSAAQLGFRCHIYADDWGPALDIAAGHMIGPYDNLGRLDEFARAVDVVTYEFENVPVDAACHLATLVPVLPGPDALRVSQDRRLEKTFISGLGIPVAPFAVLDAPDGLDDACRQMEGWNGAAILKTARMGYDGKGQVTVSDPADLPRAFSELGGVPAVLEKRVAFDYEISILAVRSTTGAIVYYDAPRNTHGSGILRVSVVPSGVPAAVEARAQTIAGRIAEALDYVGVLAVEMFHVAGADEPVMVNEIAPRVHNSGHWTMDACAISQFENHMRAVTGWPLGDTTRHSDCEMTNLIGHDADHWLELAGDGAACLHLYGKREARDGRKMGHVNRLIPIATL